MIRHDKCEAFEQVIKIRDQQIEKLQMQVKDLEDKIRALEQSSMTTLAPRKEDGDVGKGLTTL